MIEHYKEFNTKDFPLFIIRSKQTKSFEQEKLKVLDVLTQGQDRQKIQVLDLLDEDKSNSKQISELLAQINYALQPNELRTIFIGWNEKILKTGNYNKLLKVFEQPPQSNWIFLCAHKNDKLPQTILSRGIEIFENFEEQTKTENNISFDQLIKEQVDIGLKELASDLLSYTNGQLGIIEFSQKLRTAPELAEKLLMLVINHLTNGKGAYSKYMILGKIISKYGQSKEINLNKFDNILIPLKFLLVNERK